MSNSKRSVNTEANCTQQDPLAVRPQQAAKLLGISERLLWAKTNAGEIPYVRIGRAVVYPIDLLRKWLADSANSRGDGG